MRARGATTASPEVPASPPVSPVGPGGEEAPPSRRRLLGFALALAVVPLAALLPAAPASFTRFHPLRLATAAGATLLAALLATFATGGPWRRRGPSLRGPLAGTALLWLGWSALSLAWSPAPGPGLLTLGAWLLGLCWILLLRASLSRAPGGTALASLTSLLVAGALLAGLALLQRGGHLRLGLHQVTATLGNPNHLAVALVALLPAALWLGRVARASRDPVGAPAGQALAILWAGLLLAGIRATGCHAAWLAVGALALLACATWPTRSWRRRLAVTLAGAVASLAVAAAALPRGAAMAGLEGRYLLTRLGLGVVAEAPWHGAGLGGFAHQVAWVQGAHLATAKGPYSPLLDAHHQALMVGGETGLVGLALAVAVLILVFRRIWARRRRPEAQAALAAWVGILVFSLSETALRDVGVLVVAGAWLALGLGPAHVLPPVEAVAGPREAGARLALRFALHRAWRLVPVGLLAAVAFVVVGEARADHLHARGLSRLGRAGGGADRATLLAVLRDYDHARASALDTAALDLDRALVLQALGDPARAGRAARASFAALPSPERALLLGDLAAAADRLFEAVLWYQRAVDLHPRYARARNNLAVVLLRSGHGEVGCATLRRALSLRPFDPIIRGNWRALCRLP